MLPRLPWHHDGSDPGVILAGGSLESGLVGLPPRDFDLFIVAPKKETFTDTVAKTLVHDVIEAIRVHHVGETVYVSKNKHVLNIITSGTGGSGTGGSGTGGSGTVKYQIVWRVYTSQSQVVVGFDIDSCRLLYDGRSVRAHATAMRAWRNGVNFFNPFSLSTSANHRYTKKWLRLGMSVMIVGVGDGTIRSMKEVLGRLAPAGMDGLCKQFPKPTIETLLLYIFRQGEHVEEESDYDVPEEYYIGGLRGGGGVLYHRSCCDWLILGETCPILFATDEQWGVNPTGFTGSYHPVVSDIYERFTRDNTRRR